MKYLASIIILITITLCTVDAQRRGRTFRPIFGQDEQLNRTLAHITEHISLDSFTQARIPSITGTIYCTFEVNEKGEFKNIKIARGVTPWLDYKIVAAMAIIPPTVPFFNNKGEAESRKREVVFAFGSSNRSKGLVPPDYRPEVNPDQDPERIKELEKIRAQNEKWDKFAFDNTKLSLDGKSIYKPNGSPLQKPITPATPPPSTGIKVIVR